MKLSKSLFFLAGAMPALLQAGEKSPVETAATSSRWRFGMSFAPIFNVDASFSGLGGFASPFNPLPLGGGQNYLYDDGYVFVDSSGNLGGVTWNWGYDNASQYNPSGGGSIEQHLTNAAANGRIDKDGGVSPAIELFTYLDMGKVAELSGRAVNWGFKGGLHYANISVDSSRTLTSDVTRLTDSFALNGAPVPGAPYAGTFTGPGPLLGDDPSRTTTIIPGGAVVQGHRDLDVDMLTFGVGPYLEIPVAETFSVSLEAGVNVAIAHGDYEFDSTTTITALGTQANHGDKSRTVILPGAYAGLSAIWKMNAAFSLIGSARYQYLDAFEIHTGGSQAKLDFDGSAVASLGLLWNF